MTTLNLTLRVNADGSAAIAGLREVEDAESRIGSTGKRAGNDAADGLSKIEAAADRAARSTRASADSMASIAAQSSAASRVTAEGLTQSRIAYDDTSASVAGFMAKANQVEQLMSSEAKSLADVAVRRAAYNDALKAGVLLEDEHAAATGLLAKQEAALIAQSERQAAVLAQKSLAAEALVQKYALGSAAAATLAKDEAKLNELFAAGAMGGAQYAQALAGIAAKRSGLKDVANEASNTASAITHMGGSAAQVQREIGVLFGELLRGDFVRFRLSLITLTRQAGLLSTAFGFLISPIGLLVAALTLAVAISVSYARETDALNKSLIATGHYAAETAGDLRDMASTVGQSVGHFSTAKDAVKELAASGRFTGEAFTDAARGVTAFADLTGEKVEKVVGVFEKLQRDPLKTLRDLDEQYHFLTTSQYEQVASLVQMGEKYDAAKLAVKLFADMAVERDAEVKSKINGWVHPIDFIVDAWNRAELSLIKYADRVGAVKATIAAGTDWMVRLASMGKYRTDAYQTGASGGTGQFADVNSQATTSQERALKALNEQKERAKQIDLDFIDSSAKLTETMTKGSEAIDTSKVAIVERARQQHIAAKEQALGRDLTKGEIQDIVDKTQAAMNEAKQIDAATAAKKNAAAASRQAAADERLYEKIMREAADSVAQAADMADRLNQAYRGPEAQALNDYNKQIAVLSKGLDGLNTLYKNGKISLSDYLKEYDSFIGAMAEAGTQWDQRKRDIKDQNDLLGQARRELQQYIDLQSIAPTRQQAVAEAQRAYNDALRSHHDLMGNYIGDENELKRVLAEQLPQYIEVRQRLSDIADQVRLNQEAAREMAGVWSQSFNTILTTSGNIWTRLKAGFSNLVDSIIQYFARLAVVNPILNALFGVAAGGGSLLPTMASAFGGATPLNQTGGIVQSITSGFGGSSGGSGGGFDLTSGASWLNAGKSLWQGFSNGFSSLWNGPQTPGITSMAQDANGIYRATYGNVSPGVNMSYGGYSNGFTQALGIAGGVYAGYNRAQNADGAFGKVGGGLAYGVGTYYTGAAVSAALAGGVSAGLAAIPVVGWIALAAMLVDKFSGGKLFGTSYHPESSTGAISIGADGGTASASLKEVKQQALFGGRKWRESSIDPGDDARDAAQQFFTQIKQAMTAAANAMGVEMAPVIDASIRTVTEYDKKGKVTATKYYVDALGQTWEEATAELAAKRIQAEAILKQVDASAGGAASALADQFRKDAEQLLEASQFVLAAQADINKHQALLGDGATLAATLDITKSLQQADETLVQTYARLQTETAALRDSLALTGADLGKSGAEFVKFADAAAIAAGGVDNLKALMQSFSQAFYSTQEIARQQIENLSKARDAALSGLGLDTGTTREQFRALYEAALPTLTPAQLVAWQQAGVLLAQAADAQKAYNDQLQKDADSYASIVQQLRDGMASLNGTGQSDLAAKIADIRAAEKATTDQMEAAATAAGKEAAAQQDLALAHEYADAQIAKLAQGVLDSTGIFGAGASAFAREIDGINAKAEQAKEALRVLGASTSDLARVDLWAADQIAAAMSRLQARTQDLLSNLFGGPAGTLDTVNAQISALQSSLQGAAATAGSAAAAINDANAAQRAQVQLQIGDLSPYNDNQKLGIAKQAYLQGNASADDVLNIAKRLYASSNDYKQVFDWVMANPQQQAAAGGGASGGGAVSSPELDALYKLRDELQAQSAAAQRKEWAQEVIQNIADMAKQNHIDALAQLDAMGAKLPELISALGIDLKNIDANGALGLADVAKTLGVNLGDILGKLGLGFDALHNGLVELAGRMSIDLGNLNDENVKKLGDLAGVLGIGMKDLLTGLGLSLADISGGIEQMVAKLGIDLSDLTAANVKQLADVAGELHLSLADVVGALHLNLTDLAAGLTDLAKQQGIDLANLNDDSIKSLTALATSLHLSLTDLGTALGLNLGGVTSALTASTGLFGTKMTDLLTSHALDVQSVGTLTTAIDSMHSDIVQLPARIATASSNDNVEALLNKVLAAVTRGADAADRSANSNERNLPAIAQNTGDTADAAITTATNTERTSSGIGDLVRSTRVAVT